MGAFSVTIGVGDLQRQRFEEVEAVVDTGASYSQFPREVLERLGVQALDSVPSETADGRVIPVNAGYAFIRLEGREFPTPVIFVEEGRPAAGCHGGGTRQTGGGPSAPAAGAGQPHPLPDGVNKWPP